MIPVKGYKGEKVAVLGLGRSGLATAAALRAGGPSPCCGTTAPKRGPRRKPRASP
jgi:UDP-N-acetylmuramoylalanine--D-glutamate ligase